MKTHHSILISRMVKAGLKVHSCRYRVIAAGIDNRNRIISLKVNTPRLQHRGWHAEERVIRSAPKSLSKIILMRVGADGRKLPIHPCDKCGRLLVKLGIKLEIL